MQSRKRYIDFLGQSPELLGGDVSELALNLPEVFENQVALLVPGGTPSYRTETFAAETGVKHDSYNKSLLASPETESR
jgi:hypothetical protein